MTFHQYLSPRFSSEKKVTNPHLSGFLNEIVAQLWPNIQVAGSQMVKEIADPMFKTMLPGPLASLHFTKVELGPVPIVFSNVRVTKTAADGIKLDLNLDWNGKCDIELDGDMIPKVVSSSSSPEKI